MGCAKPDQKIYEVFEVKTGKRIHILIGIEEDKLHSTAARLTGKKQTELDIVDTGLTKPCCDNCGDAHE